MKKITLLITLMLLTLSSLTSVAQVVIGDGNVIDKNIPIEPFYNFTYSQVIYLQEEIGDAMNIGHLIYNATTGTTLASSNDWTVYIAHTTKTQFNSDTDWVAFADLTEVFSGIVSIDGGSVHVIFDTEFDYNGTDNLVIAVKENQDGYDSSSHDFYTSEVLANRSLTFWSDGTNPDPMDPPTAMSLQPFIANITIGPTPVCYNNICVDAIDLLLDGNYVDATNFASNASGELPIPEDICGDIGNGQDVWFAVTATEYSNITVSTQEFSGSAVDDTILVAYIGECGNLEQIGCNDDYLGSFSQLTVNGIDEGQTIYIRMFSFNLTPFGSFQIAATFVSAVSLQDTLIEGFTMYPNPVEETLSLKANISLDKISIYDMLGRMLLVSTPSAMSTELDMISLPTGSYIVKVEAGNILASYNLIKK